MLLAISFGAIAVTVFVFSCLLLAGTLYFFGDNFVSLKRLKKQLEEEQQLVSIPSPPQQQKQSTSIFQLLSRVNLPKPAVSDAKPLLPEDNSASILIIKRTILQQQQQLAALLEKAEEWGGAKASDGSGSKEVKLYEKIERLELLLEEKEEALQQISQRTEVSDMMSARLEQAQKEFELLQDRIAGLEKQAASANELAMALEDLKEEYKGVKKELSRKTEKLHSLSTENGRLHKQLCDTEDKLQEANTQRHQLAKRVALLEGLNADFQNVSEANSNLKNELRRVGELESMLNMMIEERNQLLNSR